MPWNNEDGIESQLCGQSDGRAIIQVRTTPSSELTCRNTKWRNSNSHIKLTSKTETSMQPKVSAFPQCISMKQARPCVQQVLRLTYRQGLCFKHHDDARVWRTFPARHCDVAVTPPPFWVTYPSSLRGACRQCSRRILPLPLWLNVLTPRAP